MILLYCIIMQPQKLNTNPKNHISNPQQLQNFECIICTQKSINMLQCQTCKKCLCNQCAIDQKTKQNKCPNRCTNSDLKLQLIPAFALEFKCPFSSHCPVILKTKKQFHQHDRHCDFMTELQKEEMGKKWKFCCSKGHALEIKIDVYAQLIARKACSVCSQVGIMRVQCRKCNQVFCNYCRPLPIFQLKCPVGHKLIKRQIQTLAYRCDICQISPCILGGYINDDFICNFGICNVCFKDYPQFLEPVHYVQNLNSYCDIGGDHSLQNKLGESQYKIQKEKHRLLILVEQVMKMCSWCQKEKICYKKCKICDKYYCMCCKRMQVLQNMACQYNHPFERVEDNEGQQKKDKKCHFCNSKSLQVNQLEDIYFYQDQACKVNMCEKCLNESLKYNFDVQYKQISFNVRSCFQNNSHILFYLPYRQDFIQTCNSCNKQKSIKFNCSMCEIPRNYCCVCVPPVDIKKCYCQYELLKGNMNQGKCFICDFNKLIYSCDRCCYQICQQCMLGANV